jgi:hypothetical protein
VAEKSGTPSVSVETTASGDLAIGTRIEGVFVPFVSLSQARIAQLVENAKQRAGKKAGGSSGEEA